MFEFKFTFAKYNNGMFDFPPTYSNIITKIPLFVCKNNFNYIKIRIHVHELLKHINIFLNYPVFNTLPDKKGGDMF